MNRLDARPRVDLSGLWELAFDPDNIGKNAGWQSGCWPTHAIEVDVPSVWNTVRPGYEGVAFYRRAFQCPLAFGDQHVELCFEAANYFAECWVNGCYAGKHEGGYTHFAFDVSALLRYGLKNSVVVRVIDPPLKGSLDGLVLGETACAKENWYYRFGGLWGGVNVEASSRTRLANMFVTADRSGQPAIDVHATVVRDSLVEREGPCLLRIQVSDQLGGNVAILEHEAVILTGQNEVTVRMDLPDSPRWSPANPALLNCHCALYDQSKLLDELSDFFGLRMCDLRGGEFFLNDEPLLLKGILYQPNYPITLVHPPSQEWVAREMLTIKDAGFNLVRFHLRPPHPAYLEVIDRIGLLAYEETSLSWISDGPRLRERCTSEVTETIRRDRNHPSIVLWGIFNENQPASHAVGRELLALARSLDETRPVIDNSGGTGAIDQGGAWSDETQVLSVSATSPEPLCDLHLYFGSPVDPIALDWLGGIGRGRRLPDIVAAGYGTARIMRSLSASIAHKGKLLVSELGCGGLPDLEKVAEAFGENMTLVDAREVRAYRDSLRSGLAKRGLQGLVGNANSVARRTQELQAQADSRQIEVLRSNPCIGGYIVTQFNDAAWEFHAGIVDLWRRPKRALAALARVNNQRLLAIRLRRHAALPGNRLAIEVVYVDSELRRSFEGALQLVVQRLEGAITWTQTTRFRAAVGPSTGLRRVALPREPGKYAVVATLIEKRAPIAETREIVTVVPEVALDKYLNSARLVTEDKQLERIHRFRQWDGNSNAAVLLVSRPARLSGSVWHTIMERAQTGTSVIIGELDQLAANFVSKHLGKHLGTDLALFPTAGNYKGCFHYIRKGALSRDLMDGIVDEPFEGLTPLFSLPELGKVEAGCFTSSREAPTEPGFVWYGDVQELAVGHGKLIFCQYRIFTRHHRHPIAQIMLRNLLEMAHSQ